MARVRASLHRYLSEIEAEKRQFDQLVKELYVVGARDQDFELGLAPPRARTHTHTHTSG